MENFKEIAEKCLAGELSGVFIFNTEEKLHSQYLKKSGSKNYFYLREFFIDKEGHVVSKDVEGKEIINFIPDKMQQQIKIDIPEGMEIRDIARKEHDVTITLQEKKLTYGDIVSSLLKSNSDVVYEFWSDKISEGASKPFYKKVEVLCKLTNIRNYFGKCDENEQGWTIEQGGIRRTLFESKYTNHSIVFAKKEHAEQAIKMLGDELKHLFEPW